MWKIIKITKQLSEKIRDQQEKAKVLRKIEGSLEDKVGRKSLACDKKSGRESLCTEKLRKRCS